MVLASHPFVSVIIPVYNDQAGIDRCLSALEAQTYPCDRFELIVIDNGSDPPVEVPVRTHPGVTRIVCDETGAYAARNAGVEVASGEVLAFTDADCIPDGTWLANGIHALQRKGLSCAVGGEVALTLSDRPTATELYQYSVGFMQRENIEQRGFSVTANLFVPKALFLRVGGFDRRLLSAGDAEWSWRAARDGIEVFYAPDAVVRTAARRSLISAIRQTRRVAGGRATLRKLGQGHTPPARIRPHRSAWDAARWIVLHPDLSYWNRMRVFVVAVLLKAVQWVENLRLRLGSRPERL